MPNRILREGILSSEKVNALSIGAELFYRRLMSVVDDFGRHYAHPTLLRTQVYPLKPDLYTEADIEGFLAECEQQGLVVLYQAGGRRYLELANFQQRTRQMKSKFPAPSSGEPTYATYHPGDTTDGHLTVNCQSTDSGVRSDDGQLTVNGRSDDGQLTAECGQLRTETETETETETGTEAETETETGAPKDGALPLDEFFEERYSRHPKKRDRPLAERAMTGILGIQSRQKQEEFRRGHEAWIGCEDWQWKGGAKAPTLAEFITDRTWQYPPPEPKHGAARGDPFEELERRYREEKQNAA